MSGWTPYCGAAPVPGGLLAAWNLDPVLLGALSIAALGGVRARDRRAFAAALLLGLVLFVSPLCALTSALFSARVIHHVGLAALVAPLLVRAFDLRIGHLAAATLASVGLFYAWHIPALYAAALSSDPTYWMLTVALLAASMWFWAAVRAAPAPAGVAALLVAMVAMGLLGALLTFATAPLYAPHLSTTLDWGLAPLEDQQLAGLVMWAPAAGLYLIAALAIGWRALAPRDAMLPA